MNFAHPALALGALLAGALPILVHLILRRPRTTPWPSTMLLRRALERLRRRRRIEGWLLLALRALGIALAGLAMAGPFVRGGGGGVSREVWIVIDDGATAAERMADGPAIDRLRTAALQELSELRAGDRAALVRAAVPAVVEVAPTLDIDRVRTALGTIRFRPVPSDLHAAIELALPPDSEAPMREIVVASTFRRGSVQVERPLPAAWRERMVSSRLRAIAPPESSSSNRWIASVDPVRVFAPEQGSATMRVEVERSAGEASTDAVEVRSIQGEVLARQDVEWKPGVMRMRVDGVVRSLRDGAFVVQAEPDAQPLDDQWPVTDVQTSVPRVIVVRRRAIEQDLEALPAASWIAQALDAAAVPVREIDPGSIATRSQSDAEVTIVCRPDLLDASGWKWLGRFVQDGGTVVLCPVPEGTQSWSGEASRALGADIAIEPSVVAESRTLAARQPRNALLSLLGAEIDGLAQPVSVQRHWRIRAAASDSVLVFEGGETAVAAIRPREGRGLVVLFSFPPELSCSDLPLRPLMVPLMQEIVRSSRPYASAAAMHRSGAVAALGPSAAGALLRSTDATRPVAIEVGADGRTTTPVPFPGIWKLEQRDGRARWIAVTLEQEAARIDPVSASELDAWSAPVGGMTRVDDAIRQERVPDARQSPWTIPMLLLALTLLVVESIWSRRPSPSRSVAEVA